RSAQTTSRAALKRSSAGASTLDIENLPQAMHDLDEIALGVHDRADRLVSGRALVDHVGVQPRLDTLHRLGVLLHGDELLRLGAAHHTPSAMAARVEGVIVAEAANDEAAGAHRA